MMEKIGVDWQVKKGLHLTLVVEIDKLSFFLYLLVDTELHDLIRRCTV